MIGLIGDGSPAEAVASRSDAALPEAVEVFGARLIPFTSYEQVEAVIARVLSDGDRARCVALNGEKLYAAYYDPTMRALLGSAEIGICDGLGAAFAARLLRSRRVMRCTGVDLFWRLISAAQRRGWRVYMLGASAEVNERAAKRLLALFPRLQVVGRCDGYFKDSQAVVDDVNRSQADLLFVAMGSPKQERWIWEHWNVLQTPFCMGVGGSFDVASGVKQRAPSWIRRASLEGAYRFATQPTRIGRLLRLFRFFGLVVAVRLHLRSATGKLLVGGDQ